ncbi:MAG: lipid A export permease/ATP-binding protein MsbA [Gammaproteobacteria bacterium]
MASTANKTDLHLYLRLLTHVKRYWRVFSAALGAMVMLAMITPAIAALFKYITAGVFLEQETNLTKLVILPILILFSLAGAAAYVNNLSMNWVSNKVIMDLRIAMFKRLLALPNATLDNLSAGAVISKFTYDVTQLKEASTDALTTAVRDTLTIFCLMGWMLYINWVMTLVALLAGPLIAVVLMIIRRRLRRMSGEVQDSMAGINHILEESINGHRIIKIFGGREQALRQFTKSSDQNRLKNMKFSTAAAAGSPAIQIITAFGLSAIVYIAAANAAAETMRVDEFNSFFAAILMILNPIKRLARINEHMQRGLTACESVFSFIDQDIEHDNPQHTLERVAGRLEYKQINFSYTDSSAPVLQDINVTIEPGTTVALVGTSGSGKSSLVNLLPRLYEYRQGQILLDGKDIHSLSLAELRHAMAYVGQNVILFNDTVRNNIAYGDAAGATEEAIIQAAGKAHALEFIHALPQGLDTPIGSNGSRLSGGQQQRIALARAFLKDAPILILDEATSALDTESERLIQQAMEAIKQNRTCIIIAHRLSTTEAADHIFVLDQGRIVESGTHLELLRRGGIYSRLHLTGKESTKHRQEEKV